MTRDSPLPRPTEIEWADAVRRLLLHARHLGATLEEAEDLVHDTLEFVVREPGWYDPARGDLVTALKVVLRNRYLNRMRAAGVHRRATPRLQIVQEPAPPDRALTTARAQDHRRQLLALLSGEERRLFAAWTRQRNGLPGPDAARSVGLAPAPYEAAKKRLRRRCRALLDELGLSPDDLFDPAPGGHP